MAHVVNWNDLDESAAGAGVAKRTLPGKGASLVQVSIAAGFVGGRHDHPHEQFVQVIAGSGVLETSEGVRRFGPGDIFHFPAKTWHAASFETDTVLVETNLAE